MAQRFALPLDVATIGVVTALLLWPALYSGYPLLYPDSALYIALSFTPQDYPPRGLPYPVLMYGLHWGQSLWPVIVAQCVVASWVLHEAVAIVVQRYRRLCLILLGVLLALLTGLPWTADQIMPDIFSGLTALALILTILFPDRLSLPRQLILLAIAAIGVAVHPSHALLALGIIVIGAALLRWRRAPLRYLLAPLAASLCGIALTVAIHWIVAGHLYYSQGGEQFLFGRLVDDGIVADYLTDACPNPKLELCALKDDLPQNHDDYLWGNTDAFLLLGGWQPKPELRFIVIDSFKRMPLRHLRAIVADTARQLVNFRLGESILRTGPQGTKIVEIAFPNEAVTYHNSRQQSGTLEPVYRLFDRFQHPIQLVTLVLLPIMAGWLAWRGRRRLASFGALIFVTLVLNAFVCGVLSGLHDRYQNRIVWIAVIGVLAMAGASRTTRIAEQPS